MDHITNFSPKKDQNFRPFGPFGPENFTFFILNFGSIRCFGPDQNDQKYQTIMYMAHSFRTESRLKIWSFWSIWSGQNGQKGPKGPNDPVNGPQFIDKVKLKFWSIETFGPDQRT